MRDDGNDANNGLANTAGGAFLTVQAAINAAAALDCRTYNITINVGVGTFATFSLRPMLGSGTFSVVGAGATTIFSGVEAFDAGSWTVNSFKVTSSGNGIHASGRTALSVGGTLEFGACTGAYVRLSKGADVRLFAHTISGSAARFLHCESGSRFTCVAVAVTLSGTPAFGSQFALLRQLAYATFEAVTFSGAATGTRYTVSEGAILHTAGGGANFLPGNASGSTASGGQYL